MSGGASAGDLPSSGSSGSSGSSRSSGDARHPPALARFLQAVVEASPDGVLAVSADRRVLAANQRFAQMWHLPPDVVAVGAPSPALSRLQRDQIIDPDAFEAGIRWGHEHPTEAQTLDVHLVDGRVIEGYAAPLRDEQGDYLGRVWYMHDATERRNAEDLRARLTERLAVTERSHRFLLAAADALARTSGYAATLQALAEIAVPTLGDLCLIDVLEESGEVARMAATHHDPALHEAVARLCAWPPDPHGDHPSIAAMRDRQSRMSPHMTPEFLAATTRSPEHLEVLGMLDFRSYMSVPLIADGQVLGAVTFISSGSQRVFGPDDLALAEDFAARTALVVAKERRYELQRQAAHLLQSNLLPTRLPPIPGVQVALRYLPGTLDAEIGGDFWDCVVLPGGCVEVVVGDVAGHDMVAAAQMAQIRAVLRALRPATTGPAELVDRMHASWAQLGLDRLATAAVARLDPGTGRLRVASAGHPPPLVVGPAGAAYAAVTPTPPFGSMPLPAVDLELELPKGAVAVFYTDGLVEGRDGDLDSGMARLTEAVLSGPLDDPEALADHILARQAGEDRGDDIALVVLRRLAGTATPETPTPTGPTPNNGTA